MVTNALALVEKEGPQALTMRRLATELDVTTTTIYWHVGGRDELVTEIVRRQADRLAARPVQGDSPRQRVMDAARHVWESALENRAVTSLAYQNGAIAVLEHPLHRALVIELEAAGLRGQSGADAMRAILTTVAGFLLAALRDESATPVERTSAGLWAADPGEVDPTTVTALIGAADLPVLFESAVQAVVDHYVRDAA
ncbi:MAG: TetR family transcriptional regulator [Acidimicrobiia bacterium]|nr:TetR family transcriptional regulator [Acidimicrobiia bacterium]